MMNKYSIVNIEVEKSKKNHIAKTIIIIFMIVILFILIFIVKNILTIKYIHEAYEKYENQLIILNEGENEQTQQQEQNKTQVIITKQETPQLTQQGIDNIGKIYSSETKRAFLTFDDGPSAVTPTILEILKKENIKATFFVLGSNVDAMPEMIKKIYDEGHFIANHGYTHNYSSIYSSPQSVLEEFNRCNDSVRKAIGNQDYNSHLFRFPGGLAGGKYATIKSQARELLLQNNIVNVDWNALSGDAETTKPTVEYEMKRIQETVTNKNSVVILLHDAQAKKATAEALPQIINWLREKGYEFKNFYEIIK